MPTKLEMQAIKRNENAKRKKQRDEQSEENRKLKQIEETKL